MDRNGNIKRSPDSIQTGFIELDYLLEGGLNPGDLMVIGGRPSMGATSLAVSIMKNNLCEDRAPIVLWLSFAMGYDEFMKRLIVSFCSLPQRKYHQFHLLDSRECEQLKGASETISRMPVSFDMPFDLENIKSLVKYHLDAFSRKARNFLVIIDDIQRAVSHRRRHLIPPFIKELAINLGVTVIATTDLKRNPENRISKEPRSTDLRIKGFGEHADVISLVYREAAYHLDSPDRGYAHINLTRNRSGITNITKLRYNPDTGTFENPAFV